jgi:putative tryptophan/tyrosine transport system substrate-binding protein
MTGLASQGTDYAGKQIELLRELIPSLGHVGIMFNAGSPGAAGEMRAFESTARKLGLGTSIFEIRKAEDVAPAFEAVGGQVDALDVVPDPLTSNSRIQIIASALARRCPAIYGVREFPADGGLMSFGPNLADLYRRSAEFVDKILRGTKPMDIPVEQPTKFDLVINLKTAKALDLDVPAALLARADELIE